MLESIITRIRMSIFYADILTVEFQLIEFLRAEMSLVSQSD